MKAGNPQMKGGIPQGKVQDPRQVPSPYQEVGAGAPVPAPVLFPAGFGHHLLAGDGGDEADAREPLAGQETRLEQGGTPGISPRASEGGVGQQPRLLGPEGECETIGGNCGIMGRETGVMLGKLWDDWEGYWGNPGGCLG